MSGAPTRGPWNETVVDNTQDNSVRTGNMDNRGGQQQQQSQDRQQNNDSIDDTVVDDIWNEIKKENSPAPKPGEAGYVAPQTQIQETPEQKISKYLKEQGLEIPVLSAEDQEKAKNGDFSGVLSSMTTLVQQAHVKGLQSANTLIDSKVAEAVKKAVGETRTLMNGDKALTALHTALPFTKDPAIGPVTQTVMQRFLDRGMNTEDAIKGVEKWRDRFLEKADPNYRKSNSNLNGSFRGNPDVNASEGETNWVDLLTGRNSNK